MYKRSAFAIVVLVSALACGGSGNSPSPARPSPTSPAPTPTLDLTGTWRGTIQLGNGEAFFQWTAARSGDGNLTGEARIAGPVFGTLGGSLSGTQLTATISYPAGAYTASNPAWSMCTWTGNGTLTASATTLSGVIVGRWPVAVCPGFSSDAPMTVVMNHQVSLTKVATP